MKFGLIVFGLIFFIGSLSGFILGMLFMFTATCQPGDVCDGPAMAAGALWFTSFWGSAILGLLLGSFSAFVLNRKTKPLPKVAPSL